MLTGDLRKLDYGVVTWKMDGMGTISLEEVKIKTIHSKKEFEVKMRTGEIIFCSFDSSEVAEKVFLGKDLFNLFTSYMHIIDINHIQI